jgi:hypothetical protein
MAEITQTPLSSAFLKISGTALPNAMPAAVVVKKVVAFFYKFLSSMISKNVHVQGANMIAPD